MTHQAPKLTEKEFRTFMRPKKRNVWLVTILYLVLMTGLFASGFFVLNSAALLRSQSVAPQPTQTPLAVATPLPSQTSEVTPTPTPEIPSLPTNTVAYNSLNVSAPVHWDVAFKESTFMSKLQEGVIHLDGTPHPGDQGMSVIFGHSSHYPWAKGSYKTIFAPLTQAKAGDSISIEYKNTVYTYTVSKIYEVKADHLEILSSDSKQRGVRLITCTPIGTSLRRLVVEATQVSPDPTTNKPFEQKSFTGELPGDS